MRAKYADVYSLASKVKPYMGGKIAEALNKRINSGKEVLIMKLTLKGEFDSLLIPSIPTVYSLGGECRSTMPSIYTVSGHFS